MPTPSKRTPEVEERILTALRNGIPLAVVCREPGMPHPTTWNDWCAADEALKIAHGLARDEGYDAIAYRLRETARKRGDSTDDVQRDKLIIETDLKLLAKWDPRRYGDKVALTGGSPDDAPIRTEGKLDVSGLSEAALREIAAMRVEKG